MRLGLPAGGAAALIALAIAAPGAQGAATRAEYAAQANSICDASFAQQKALADRFNRRYRRLPEGKEPGAKVVAGYYRRSLRISVEMVGGLSAVAAAPGDESLVASWVAEENRLLTISQRMAPLFVAVFKYQDGKSRKARARALAAYRRLIKLDDRHLAASRAAFDLGTQLGVTSCVSDPGEHTIGD